MNSFEKKYYWMMDPDIREELVSSPAAFKIFVACLFEGIGADLMYENHKLYERYGLNRNSLRTHETRVNRALDEYWHVSGLC